MMPFLKRLIGRMRAKKPYRFPGKADGEPPLAVVSPMLRHFAHEPGDVRNAPTEVEILRTYQEAEATLRNMRS